MKRTPPENASSPGAGVEGSDASDPTDALLRRAGAEFRQLSADVLAPDLDRRREEAIRAAKSTSVESHGARGFDAIRGVLSTVWRDISVVASGVGALGPRMRVAAAYAFVIVFLAVGIQQRRGGSSLRTVDRGGRSGLDSPVPATPQTEITPIAEVDLLPSGGDELGLDNDESDLDADLDAVDEELADEEAEQTSALQGVGIDDGAENVLEDLGGDEESSTLTFDGERMDGLDHQPLGIAEEDISDTEDYEEEQYEQS